MVRSIRFLLPTTLLAALFSLSVLAANLPYERSTEVTLDGSTLYVADGPSGVYAIMKDGLNEIEVFLAPSEVLEKKGVHLQTGDSIRVVGSRVTWNGAEVIVAREVTQKGKTTILRDKDGTPRW
jgi:hypothetical protein